MNIQEITNKVEAVLERADEALYVHMIAEQAMITKDEATAALKRLSGQGMVEFTPTQGRWGNRYALVRSAKPVTTEAQRQEETISRLEEVLAEEGLKVPDAPEGMKQMIDDVALTEIPANPIKHVAPEIASQTECQGRINELAEIATAALYNHGEAAQAMLDIITHPDGEHVFNGLIEDSRRAYMRAVYFHMCDVNEALHKIGGAV